MSRTWRFAAIMAGISTLLTFTACVSFAVTLSRLKAAVDSLPEPIEYATVDVWHSEEPPAGEEILGLWYSGNEARSHVVIMAFGLYYPASLGRTEPVEVEPPVYWRRLP